MNQTISQLAGMARYELLMGWRRGGLRMILAVVALMPAAGFFLFASQAFKSADSIAQLTAEGALWLRTANAISDNFFFVPVTIFLLPLLFAEVIPLDRQRKVRELIDALPLPPWGYLAGKMLAAWTGLSLATLAAAAINVGLNLVYRGPFLAGPFVSLWLLGLWPLVLLSSQAGVMLAAGQPDRRRAILAGGLACLVTAGAYFLLPINDLFLAAFIQASFIPAHPTIDIARYPGYPDLAEPLMVARLAAVAVLMAAMWWVTARRVGREG